MKGIKSIILIICVIAAFSANAQFKIGAGVGINNASFSGIDATGTTSLTSFNVGAVSEFKFPAILGVEVDVLFSGKGAAILGFKDNKKQ